MTVAGLSTGRLGDPSAVRSLQLDDIVATYVVDGVLLMDTAFFPGIPSDFWATRHEFVTSGGALPMSAGGLLIEREGATLLIDAGVGPTLTDFALADIDCGAMIDVLAAIGHRPEDIDVVAFTHLHFDHAGWAFANGDKTFPNAAIRWPHASGLRTPTVRITGTRRHPGTSSRRWQPMSRPWRGLTTAMRSRPGCTPSSRPGTHRATRPT